MIWRSKSSCRKQNQQLRIKLFMKWKRKKLLKRWSEIGINFLQKRKIFIHKPDCIFLNFTALFNLKTKKLREQCNLYILKIV
uniref:Uncharacterized protein n=1 Tax=Phlebotomus papatasi TaxID=29031 RepID=A0A1B0D3W0_PHLPP